MKKIFIAIIPLILILVFASSIKAGDDLNSKLAGKILLQVESSGEAWYVNPVNLSRYYLGRPKDAFEVMQYFGIGIKNIDLLKIPVGLIELDDNDDDFDLLTNRLETALGTMPLSSDSDNDGYSDYDEIINSYNPLGEGSILLEEEFARANSGRILLQVENNGEAWYVNPEDLKRYYLGRPSDAFSVMENLGLGISEYNIKKITTGEIDTPPPLPVDPPCADCDRASENIILGAGQAIRDNDVAKAKSYFSSDMHAMIEYLMDTLDADGRLTLGSILSSAKLDASSNSLDIYTNDIHYSLANQTISAKFNVTKQPDDSWLLTNL